MNKIYWGENCINYYEFSEGTTLIFTSDWISECRLTFTLKVPKDLISSASCIIDGFISNLSNSRIIFEISVGFTDPYNSLFSVLNLWIEYSFPLIFSWIFFAFFFFPDLFYLNLF